MAMAWIWTGMVAASVVFGLVNGTIGAVSARVRRWSCV